jgi:hypothetical protein
MVVTDDKGAILRDNLQPGFPQIPENPYKTRRNPKIYVDRPVAAVEICSAHQNSLECVWIEDLVLPISSALPGRKAC